MAGLFTMAPPMAPTDTPQVPSSNGSGIGQNFGSHGPPSTLLFGFLVSFLALFIIFMIFGLGSRHYLDLRRRQRRLFEGDQFDSDSRPSEPQTPALWDVSVFAREKEKCQWEELMPLAVEVQRDADSGINETLSPEALEALRAQQTLTYMAQLSVADRLFYASGEFFHKIFTALRHLPRARRRFNLENPAPAPVPVSELKPTIKGTTSLPMKEKATVDVQISVIVAMPESSSARRQQHERQMNDTTELNEDKKAVDELRSDGLLPYVVIGVTNVSWDKDGVQFG